MTLKVIGFKEYVYIRISLHSIGLEVWEGKKSIKKATFCHDPLYLRGTVFNKSFKKKKKMRTMFPDIAELSTFAYRK